MISYTVCTYVLFYRYSITCELNQGHLVLGKVTNISVVPSTEKALLEEYDIDYSTAKCYHRTLVSGVLYTSASYKRSQVKNDSILYFRRNNHPVFGIAQHYISFCNTSCTRCTRLCKSLVIMLVYNILPDKIDTDRLTGATAVQIFHVQSTGYV